MRRSRFLRISNADRIPRRHLVHTFRHRTLVLVKALILQKRVCVAYSPSGGGLIKVQIMFSGHPVERLCTYQYSLISLIPGSYSLGPHDASYISRQLLGLLQTLEDCGSPPLAARAPTLTRPASLRTSDRRSMMAYAGLPLDVFGKVYCFPNFKNLVLMVVSLPRMLSSSHTYHFNNLT